VHQEDPLVRAEARRASVSPLRPEGRSYAKERGKNFRHHEDPLVRAEARCSSVFPLRPEGRSYAKKGYYNKKKF